MDVIAINRREASAILENGTIIHFSLMLDMDGEETDDMEQSIVAVAPLPDGNWCVIDFSQFETVAVH